MLCHYRIIPNASQFIVRSTPFIQKVLQRPNLNCREKVENKSINNTNINPLNVELNPICHFLALIGAHSILHVSRIGVKSEFHRRTGPDDPEGE
jgi:transposase